MEEDHIEGVPVRLNRSMINKQFVARVNGRSVVGLTERSRWMLQSRVGRRPGNKAGESTRHLPCVKMCPWRHSRDSMAQARCVPEVIAPD